MLPWNWRWHDVIAWHAWLKPPAGRPWSVTYPDRCQQAEQYWPIRRARASNNNNINNKCSKRQHIGILSPLVAANAFTGQEHSPTVAGKQCTHALVRYDGHTLPQKSPSHGDEDCYLINCSLDPHESAPKWHSDQFRCFCTAYKCDGQTDTLSATYAGQNYTLPLFYFYSFYILHSQMSVIYDFWFYFSKFLS